MISEFVLKNILYLFIQLADFCSNFIFANINFFSKKFRQLLFCIKEWGNAITTIFGIDNGVCQLFNRTRRKQSVHYAGQDTAVVKITANDGKAIENDLIYGSVSGKKVDENGDSLGGALIGLFRTDDGEVTKENALMTTTSAKDGSFSFENIPYGTWYVREIEQPAGFVLDDTIYPVTIGADGQIVEIKIVNKYVRGNIHLTKVDSEYPDNKLTGATFEVYKDSNATGKLDDGDELLGTLTEREKGEYSMNDLFHGRYFVKETKAPEGFVLDTGVYEVMIDTNGKTYEVENKAGVGFINEAMRGNLKIVKTSSDGKVKGFAFRITGANGYDIIECVNACTIELLLLSLTIIQTGAFLVGIIMGSLIAPFTKSFEHLSLMIDATIFD